MAYTIEEVLEFIAENDVKFIRLAFGDLSGIMKNISVIDNQLERVLRDGLPADVSPIRGFEDAPCTGLLLTPDPGTLNVLPWRPQQGRVARLFCDLKNADGTPFACDARQILKRSLARCAAMGYQCRIGVECSFYLFRTDENGEPTSATHDEGGYLDIAPLDKGENIRREICLCLEDMGMGPETSHHEQGPGQHEIDFKYSDALSAADNFLAFKAMVKAVAARNGLFASFMPQPLKDRSASGLHINLSLYRQGVNLFQEDRNTSGLTVQASRFVAGVLQEALSITPFLHATDNSYERFAGGQSPVYASWSRCCPASLIQIPEGSGPKARMRLCSSDPAINPYLAFALLIHAGLDGIEAGAEPLLPIIAADTMPATAGPALPQSLQEALALAENDGFIARALGEEACGRYISIKREEMAAAQSEAAAALHLNRVFRAL